MIDAAALVVCAGNLSILTVGQCEIDVAGEPEWRCAVSRAYYAAFHHAKGFLEEHLGAVAPSKSLAHREVSAALGFTGVPDLQRAGRQLASLRAFRNRSDYKIAAGNVAQQNAKAAVSAANAIIRLIDSPLAAPPAQIVTILWMAAANLRANAAQLPKWTFT